MTKEITMPKLSDTMTDGLFAGWRKKVGDQIERGEIIAEIETDKAVMELEAFASGTLLKIMISDGEVVPVGTVIGLIGEQDELDDESVAESDDTSEAAPPSAPTPDTAQRIEPKAPAVMEQTSLHNEQEHDKASPMVRRIARDKDIDLGSVPGSGPDGRITQEDLESFIAQKDLPSADMAVPATPVVPENQHDMNVETQANQPVSAMRRAIATAVTHSWQTIPHFSVTIEITMDACREVVTELKTGTHPIGYNALLIKACAATLVNFPLLQTADNDMHINFAVALPDGLLLPTIRNCDSLTVSEIEQEANRLIEKCKSGRLASSEMSGGCFTISNLGMFGVDEFTALIMPGQTAILAVGAVT